jgi:hypothetical protein
MARGKKTRKNEETVQMAFCTKTLMSINLREGALGVMLSDEPCPTNCIKGKAVEEYFAKFRESISFLEVTASLNGDCERGCELLEKILPDSQVKTLYIRGPNTFTYLEALKKCLGRSKVEFLKITETGFIASTAATLFELTHLGKIRTLHLQETYFVDSCDFTKLSPRVTNLILYLTKFSDDTRNFLCKYLQLGTLRTLKVHEFKASDQTTLKKLLNAISGTGLIELRLVREFHDRLLPKLMDLYGDLAHVVETCKSLKKLQITPGETVLEAFPPFIETCADSFSLEELCITGANNFTEKGRVYAYERLRRAMRLKLVNVGTRPFINNPRIIRGPKLNTCMAHLIANAIIQDPQRKVMLWLCALWSLPRHRVKYPTFALNIDLARKLFNCLSDWEYIPPQSDDDEEE